MSEKTKMILMIVAALALVSLAAGPALAAPVTQSITYQGKLTDATGSPLTGTYAVTFGLYGAATGGTALASSSQAVTCANGLFTAPLSFSPEYFRGGALWLGIRVGSDAEMTPRQEIRPVPYALGLRPGAWITGADTAPILNLKNTGNGIGLNVSLTGNDNPGIVVATTGIRSEGIHVETLNYSSEGIVSYTNGDNSEGLWTNTTGANAFGVRALTAGGGSHGVYATTTGPVSHGLNAETAGEGSFGVRVKTSAKNSEGVVAYTSGANSEGLWTSTAGSDAFGVHAITSGANSHGVVSQTSGTGSYGADVFTSADSGRGLNVSTKGRGSFGVFTSTTGIDSEGVVAYTKGAGSEGLWTDTAGNNAYGVHAITHGTGSHGVVAETDGAGSYGVSTRTEGDSSYGVNVRTNGPNSDGVMVWTNGGSSEGVFVVTAGTDSVGVFTYSDKATGIYADTGRGDNKYGVQTPDIIRALGYETGASDVAEYMPVTGDLEPGTVLIIGADMTLEESSVSYDTRVAGILSTAPGVSLGAREGGNPGEELIAISGRVPCRVDATGAPIHAGDLLTTSDNPGHAMKAEPVDVSGVTIYRPGTIIGKAMGSLESGTGTLEVLVTLQ